MNPTWESLKNTKLDITYGELYQIYRKYDGELQKKADDLVKKNLQQACIEVQCERHGLANFIREIKLYADKKLPGDESTPHDAV